jgi:hypothetical protein
MGAALSVYSDLLASGAAFRQRLTAADVRDVSAARFFFHATSLAPALLYYLRFGADASRPKFPVRFKGQPNGAVVLQSVQHLRNSYWTNQFFVPVSFPARPPSRGRFAPGSRSVCTTRCGRAGGR